MKAWRTTLQGITSIVLAETRGQAKCRTVLAADEAGYGKSFNGVHAVMAPEYDDAPVAHGRALSEDFVKSEMGRNDPSPVGH